MLQLLQRFVGLWKPSEILLVKGIQIGTRGFGFQSGVEVAHITRHKGQASLFGSRSGRHAKMRSLVVYLEDKM